MTLIEGSDIRGNYFRGGVMSKKYYYLEKSYCSKILARHKAYLDWIILSWYN